MNNKKFSKANRFMAGLTIAAGMLGAGKTVAQPNTHAAQDSHEQREARLRLAIHSAELELNRVRNDAICAAGTDAAKRDSLTTVAAGQVNEAGDAMAQRTQILDQAVKNANNETEFVIFASLAPSAEYIASLLEHAENNLHAADSLNSQLIKAAQSKTR